MASRPACRKLLAICETSREFWHVAALAWQKPSDGHSRPKGRREARDSTRATTATNYPLACAIQQFAAPERGYRNASRPGLRCQRPEAPACSESSCEQARAPRAERLLTFVQAVLQRVARPRILAVMRQARGAVPVVDGA
jgi:hypothetical protein